MLWMAVTADKYEFPLAIEETSGELALKLKISSSGVVSKAYRDAQRKEKAKDFGRPVEYRIVKVDERSTEGEEMAKKKNTNRPSNYVTEKKPFYTVEDRQKIADRHKVGQQVPVEVTERKGDRYTVTRIVYYTIVHKYMFYADCVDQYGNHAGIDYIELDQTERKIKERSEKNADMPDMR